MTQIDTTQDDAADAEAAAVTASPATTALEGDATSVRARVAELDKTNRHDITIPLLRRAFEAGLDPYFALDVVIRVLDKKGRASANAEIHRLSEALPGISFSFQGDDFHKDMVARALRGFASLIDYESGSGADPAALVAGFTDHVKGAIWQRMWQLVHVQDRAAIGRLAVLYPLVYQRDPLQTIFAVDYFLTRYGFWSEARDALDGMAVTESTSQGLIALRLAWLVEVDLNLGREADAEAAADALWSMLADAGLDRALTDPDFATATVNVLWSVYFHAGLRAEQRSTVELRDRVVRIRDTAGVMTGSDKAAWCFQQMTLLLAHIEEDANAIAASERLYLQSSQFRPDGYLPAPFQRAAQFLAAHGHWHQSAEIHRHGVLALWPHYEALASVSAKARYDTDDVLPSRAVVLNCEGIGDDIMRIAMLVRFKGFDSSLAFVVDDRLRPGLQRALPGHEFLVRSRCTGSHAVDVETYHNDRVGVPASVDSTRVTRHIMRTIEDYGEVCLSEDVVFQYLRNGGEFPVAFDRPILVADAAHVSRARTWLQSLPPRTINVGLSWRTGAQSAFRDRNQFRLEELGELFRVSGVNWIALQYSITDEELRLVERLFGVTLRLMPEVDLRDDIDKILGLVHAIDLTISTPSAIKYIAAAAGARVLGLSPGYYSVSQFRIAADGETDRILPSMTTLTARKFGSKAAIVAEAAKRLAQFGAVRHQPSA